MATMSPQRSGSIPIQVGPPQKPTRERQRHRVPSWALKSAMAISGLLWVVFVAIHLFGNLKAFQGAEAFNGYAAWLREALYPLLPKEFLLWTLRIALALSLLVHVAAAAMIWARGRRSRGGHRVVKRGFASWSAWLMPVTGVVVLVFIVVHLLDLTLGIAPVAPPEFAHPGDGVAHAYENLIASFQRPVMAWFYVVVMVLLSLHVAKGFGTLAVDLGVMGRRLRASLSAIGGLLAIVILLGNAAIPIFVQRGWLT